MALLGKAIDKAAVETVVAALAAGESPNDKVGVHRFSCLHKAMYPGINKALFFSRLRIVELLCVDPRAQLDDTSNTSKQTPLHLGVLYSNLEGVRLWLAAAKKAKLCLSDLIYLTDNYEQTAYSLAVLNKEHAATTNNKKKLEVALAILDLFDHSLVAETKEKAVQQPKVLQFSQAFGEANTVPNVNSTAVVEEPAKAKKSLFTVLFKL